MILPLYGFLRGDSLGLVLLVHDHQSWRDVGRHLQCAAAVRVAPTLSFRVYSEGRLLPLDLTVRQTGLRPFSRIDVLQEDEP
jgi:hypothetical protein